ncbi:MAG: hypothetical protein ACPG7F_08165 [Aggregatilineales bacterium]
MPTQINRKTFNDLLTLLTPYMRAGLRDVLIDSAFFGTPLVHIDRSGNNRVFASRLLNDCLQYGDIEVDEPAIVALLQELKHHVGVDGQIRIDTLISQMVAPSETTPDDIFQQTEILLNNADYAAVIALCTQLIADDDSCSAAYSRRARAYERIGDTDRLQMHVRHAN